MVVLTSPLQIIASTPPATRVFTAATVATSMLYAWLHWKGTNSTPYLTLVPGSSIFYPWTFVTSALVETSVFELIASLIFVPPSLRYLERLWGPIETAKFIVVTVAFSNFIAFAFNWIEFIVTRNADLFLYGMQYHGQMSLQIGILVAFTQLIPEHQVQLMGVVSVRVKSLPMGYLSLSTVLTIIGFQCPWVIVQFGWFVSWIYLRFYKKNTGDIVGGGDTYGDRSETFSLISWFPPVVHYPLSLLANSVYGLANRFHLIPASHSDIESGISGIYSQVPGSARAEAERRRAMALKALDQRLANNASPSNLSPLPQSSTSRPASNTPPQSDGSARPPSPTAPARSNERKKSVSEVDVVDSGKERVA